MYFIPYNYSLKIIGVFTLKKWINSLFIILFFIFKDFNKTDRIGIELIVNWGGEWTIFMKIAIPISHSNSSSFYGWVRYLQFCKSTHWLGSITHICLQPRSSQKKSIFFKYCEIPFYLGEIVYFNMLNLLFFFSPFFLRIW